MAATLPKAVSHLAQRTSSSLQRDSARAIWTRAQPADHQDRAASRNQRSPSQAVVLHVPYRLRIVPPPSLFPSARLIVTPLADPRSRG